MLEMIRKRFSVWLALQQLSWMALWRDPAVLALSLKQAVIEREVADQGSEEELMRQAFAVLRSKRTIDDDIRYFPLN